MWSKISNMFSIVANFLTPVKAIALMILLLGIVDNLTSLLQHVSNNGNVSYQSTIFEWVVRIAFIFCGTFGLLGNGKTKQIRAIVVSLPLLYLGSFFFVLFVQYNNPVLLVLSILTISPGIWSMFLGERYE